jgi:hypothetical protein
MGAAFLASFKSMTYCEHKYVSLNPQEPPYQSLQTPNMGRKVRCDEYRTAYHGQLSSPHLSGRAAPERISFSGVTSYCT